MLLRTGREMVVPKRESCQSDVEMELALCPAKLHQGLVRIHVLDADGALVNFTVSGPHCWKAALAISSHFAATEPDAAEISRAQVRVPQTSSRS